MTAQPGLLVVWMNIEPALAATFDQWYTHEHVPERVGVPGFRNGSRYEALHGTPRFCAAYDTDTADVLSSPAYRERLANPTPLSQRVMRGFRDTVRSPTRVLAQAGQGLGGVLRTVRLEPAPGRDEPLRAALAGDVAHALAARPGVLRLRVAEAVGPTQPAQTAETALRGADRVARFVLLLDGSDPAALEAACADLLAPARLEALGALAPAEVGDYRLLFSLSR